MILIEFLKKIRHKYSDKVILDRDIKKYSPYYATSYFSSKNGCKDSRNILVFCHVIEKGLSHKNIKPLFAYDRIRIVTNSINDYLKKGGNDSFIINLAVSTIEHYNDINRKMGVPEKKLLAIPEIIKKDSVDVGVDCYNSRDLFLHCDAPFSVFCASRHSVRLYECKSKSIDKKIILECIKIAQNCPSACNRQAVRLKVITNDELIKKVCEIQGGANGFGENAGALVVVTSIISLYEPDERRIPMLDCGLFIMNLVYAFFEKKIGSCILNGSFTKEREIKMNSLVPISQDEMYAAIIALSVIPDDEIIRVAHSPKRLTEDIVDFL